MRPVVVTAVLLLVVLMSMSASAWTPEVMCRTKYPATRCIENMGQPGWYQFGQNRCVKAFLPINLRHKAKEYCKRIRGGDLVSIHSLVELCQVECAMYRTSSKRRKYWIGLQRKGKTFVWTDGSKYDYHHWAKRQPDNSWWSEYCVEMNYGGWGLWNDADCRLAVNSAVCQVRL